MIQRLVAPISITLDIATRHLKQAIGAVVCHDFLCYTSRAPDLVAVLAVEQVLERVQTVVCTGSPGIEGLLESVEFMCRGRGIAVTVTRQVCRVGAGTLDVHISSRSCRSGHRDSRRRRRRVRPGVGRCDAMRSALVEGGVVDLTVGSTICKAGGSRIHPGGPGEYKKQLGDRAGVHECRLVFLPAMGTRLEGHQTRSPLGLVKPWSSQGEALNSPRARPDSGLGLYLDTMGRPAKLEPY